MANLYVLNGPSKGRIFALKEGASFLGRSLDNDIVIQDRTLSRKHLRILKTGNEYLIKDLKSRNGTFYKGDFLKPGFEVQVEEGSPIAVGMTVIGIGEGCEEPVMPFPDVTGLVDKDFKKSGGLEERRIQASLKTIRFLDRLSGVFKEDLPLEESLRKILDHIFTFLKRIDRAAFVLLDPESGKINGLISRIRKARNHHKLSFCVEVVKQVIDSGRPFVLSNVETEQSGLVDTLKVFKIQSVMCVPLMSKSRVLGAIYVDSLNRPYGFRWEDLLLFVDFSQRLAVVLENVRDASGLMAPAEALSSDKEVD
jgi:adenylate cyclase